MPSPFPGMDPYLEDPAFWPDFHASFITYWRDALAERLPESYEARIGERVNLVQLPAQTSKRIGPDVAVTWQGPSRPEPATEPGVATVEPVTIPNLMEEEVRETYIEILRRKDRTLISVLELLSPSNKENSGRGLYLAKRNALLVQDIHLFELDLLLGGERLPLERPLPEGDYYTMVSRSDRRPDCEVYVWTIEATLPTLPVPLKAPDPDLPIDVGAVFSVTFERGRYARSLSYEQPPAISAPGDALERIERRAKARK